MNTFIYSDEMISSIKSYLDDVSKFITYPKFVFLCGKECTSSSYYESNRGILEKYINSKTQDAFIMLSERLWEDSFDSSIDLLTFEEFLAEVCDCIILFVESPGSFCELGAFAYADKLFSDKLIIVNDNKHESGKSFIIKGPTAKAKKNGSKIVYAPIYGNGLLSSSSLRKTIDDKICEFSSKNANANKRIPNQFEQTVQINSFIIEILELVKILQPINRKDLIDIYKLIKGFSAFEFVKKDGEKFNSEIKVEYIFKLLTTVGIISVSNDLISSDLYKKSQNLMLKYSKKVESKERNKLLCRKYRYRGTVK